MDVGLFPIKAFSEELLFGVGLLPLGRLRIDNGIICFQVFIQAPWRKEVLPPPPMRLLVDECSFLQWVSTEHHYMLRYKGLEPRAWEDRPGPGVRPPIVCLSLLGSFCHPSR